MDDLHNLGFTQSRNDYSLFVKRQGGFITILGVYVDDILIKGNHIIEINHIKKHLHDTFTIKDLWQLHFFLGIEISYTSEGMVLTK